MRIFSLVGLLITVVLIGWLASTMFRSVTGGPVVSPAGSGGTGVTHTTTAPIERAQELASQDQVRQNKILDLEGKL